MAQKRTSKVYQEAASEPGIYEYRSERFEEIKAADARLWNEEAVQKLDEMYVRLGVPAKWRK